MAYVKLLKDKGNRRKGEILQMDSGSAASLVKREYAELVTRRTEAEPEAEREAPRRGGVIVTQVVEDDNPNAAPPAPDEAADDDPDDEDEDDEDEDDEGDPDADR